MARKCKDCGADLHTRHTGRGFRTFHPNGQSFCAVKAERGAYVPDHQRMGYQDRGEYRAMSPQYRAEISGRVDESLRD
jgi:hypothetical protein